VLEEPDEVQLQLADSAPRPKPKPAPDTPMVGTSPRWVPDGGTAQDTVFPAAPPPPLTTGVPDIPAAPASDAFNFDVPAVANGAAATNGFPNVTTQPTSSGGSTHELDFASPVPSTDGAEAGEASAVNRVRGRRRKNRMGPVVIGVGTALFVACMLGLWWQQKNSADAQTVSTQPAPNPQWEEQKVELADSNADAQSLSPTSGEAIPLDYMPFAPQLVFHLRPAEIWGPGARQQEFMVLTYDLGKWLKKKVVEITRFEPQEIEELTFAMNFGARTSEPDFAAVVRLKADQTESDLQLNRFRGQIRLDLEAAKIFEAEDYAYMLVDSKTFVAAPKLLATELAESKSYSRPALAEIEPLLLASDRQRQMTLSFSLPIIDDHREYVFGPTMQDFADSFVLWFGKEVQGVSWSFHLGTDALHMETLLLPDITSSELKVQRHLRGQLSKLPTRLHNAARFMKPQSAGSRKMIGRFPAMMQATTLGTSNSVDKDFVRLVTYLPDKAAGNLAAGSILAWYEAGKTDFSGPAPTNVAKSNVPDAVADRLKMPVLVDFRRMPLQEAFGYVADEIKTPLSINGDALKLAGMTQNMPQTYNLGEVSALKAVDAMLSNPEYKGMLVLIVDEEAKTLQLTTRPVAEEAGLTIYDTKK